MFEYYESLGVLEVTPTTLPDTQPTDPVLANMFVYENNGRTSDQTWRTEQISVNDCFLKNMNLFGSDRSPRCQNLGSLSVCVSVYFIE